MSNTREQKSVCKKYGSAFGESLPFLKVGISKNVRDGVWPINGLRHPLEGDTTGWYIWTGQYSTDIDFFEPLHVVHLEELYPQIVNYLGLAPGWRFLLGKDNYVDVWQDESLLNIK